jgi:hypothetical protein
MFLDVGGGRMKSVQTNWHHAGVGDGNKKSHLDRGLSESRSHTQLMITKGITAETKQVN